MKNLTRSVGSLSQTMLRTLSRSPFKIAAMTAEDASSMSAIGVYPLAMRSSYEEGRSQCAYMMSIL
jgi:hypothetical protein